MSLPPSNGSRGIAELLRLSVIVSAQNSGRTLHEVLSSVRASLLPHDCYELIVVDDASTDSSVAVAARFADTVIRLTGRPGGLAYARNRGAEIARGEVIVFVDGDVVVRPDTLPGMLATLEARPDIAAVSASHDEKSSATNFISQYWNVLLRFGEELHAGRCAQFATGCGAIRREAFLAAGMYDEWRFATACLESAELGERLSQGGHGVLLSSNLKVGSLRRWHLLSVCREVWRRARLLARSLGYARMSAAVPSEVVFTLTRTMTPAVSLLGTLSLAAAFVPSTDVAIKSAVVLVILVLANLPLHRFYARTHGVAFAVASVPLHIVTQVVAGVALCTGWLLREVFGDPSPDATTQAYAEVGLETWPPVPRRP